MVLFYLLVALLFLAVLYLLTLPAHCEVQRSIRIQKPLAEVYGYVRNLNHWGQWSPWVLHDASTDMTFDRATEIGGSYSWSSGLIGAGKMTKTAEATNEAIALDLQFFKPFKSRADVKFEFAGLADSGGLQAQTEVSWQMRSKFPIFMRPFRAMFERMIGHDFELGLGMLRGQLDPASEHPVVTFEGSQTLPSQTCAILPYSGLLSGLGAAMGEAYGVLYGRLSPDNLAGSPLGIYRKTNLSKLTTECDIAVPVKVLPSNEAGTQTPGGAYYVTQLKGSYSFLPAVWNAAFGHVKMLKLKVDGSRPSLEVYSKSAECSANTNHWVTLVAIPVK